MMDCDSRPDRGFNIICFRLFAKIDINWVSTTRDIEPWSSIEVLLEFGCIKSSRHDNQLKIWSFDENLFNQPEQNIGV